MQREKHPGTKYLINLVSVSFDDTSSVHVFWCWWEPWRGWETCWTPLSSCPSWFPCRLFHFHCQISYRPGQSPIAKNSEDLSKIQLGVTSRWILCIYYVQEIPLDSTISFKQPLYCEIQPLFYAQVNPCPIQSLFFEVQPLFYAQVNPCPIQSLFFWSSTLILRTGQPSNWQFCF